jgi:[acyl-carrier-protein] S-malonyltransferase
VLQESKDLLAVKKMLEAARRVLGYDLLALCNEGPKDKLDDTVYSQVNRGKKVLLGKVL